MVIKEEIEELSIDEGIISKYKMANLAYFDIETTGFDKELDSIVLISLGSYLGNNKFKVKQYFCEGLEQEGYVLKAFKEDIEKYDIWCSYNGLAFDEPFIISRMFRHSICFQAPKEHIDLYRIIRPYHKQLGMERCNLKTVEKYVGIEREDQIDGGISVELYKKYLETKDETLKKVIMLHNFEDVLNLPSIFKVLYDIDNTPNLQREDHITEKQQDYLEYLLKKNNIDINIDMRKLSRKTASKLIDGLIKGIMNIQDIIKGI